MEKEKQSDKLENCLADNRFSKYHISSMVYPLFLIVSNIFSKNLFNLIIIATVVYISWLLSEITIIEKKYIRTIGQLYLVFSSYSFLYISNNNDATAIYLWILFLLLSVKILEYFLNEILIDYDNKKFRLVKFFINSIMIVMVGVIYSIFMRQKITVSILVNFIVYILIYLVRLLPEKYQKNKFLICYNTIAFPIIFICVSLISGILPIR